MQAFRKIAAMAAFATMTQLPVMAQQTNDSVLQRIILIGDAGELQNGRNAVIDAVKQRIDLDKGNNTVLFLGDNIYPKGLPPEVAQNYPGAKAIIDYQINLIRGTNANGYIIPGNHDWKKQGPGGWETVQRQQRYVDSQYLANVQFFPKDACPGPVGIPLGDQLLLIIMDSEWWLHQYEKPGLTSSCDCKTEDEVTTAITDVILRNPGRLVVFATHHPFRSYGPHGGYYTLKQHIFPFTDRPESLAVYSAACYRFYLSGYPRRVWYDGRYSTSALPKNGQECRSCNSRGTASRLRFRTRPYIAVYPRRSLSLHRKRRGCEG
ncbi:metallophosphoesterase [Chitinophaga sedimenti]|uniref:metallophosphoesterase n=1 Tax=Chitinophaga sedimenti TaxID=2033606 RepID=UPI002006277D|nr:metallophosphoesterase [Chitinophaga sedimenti]MCK7559310.1 metallophosphoesterase [Chitinophaga sedimenti]